MIGVEKKVKSDIVTLKIKQFKKCLYPLQRAVDYNFYKKR